MRYGSDMDTHLLVACVEEMWEEMGGDVDTHLLGVYI